MIIGTFSYDKAKDSFFGDIQTLNFQFGAIDIKPTGKTGAKEPSYRVTSRTANGHVELGAAWKRTSEKGLEFLSVSLDSPLLAAPLNAALFADEDGDGASLVWNRSKPKAKASTKQVA